jgi:haloacetate dehalogenase
MGLSKDRERALADAPAMPPLQPHGPDLMRGFRRERIRTRGAEINIAIAGEGPPLLLLHGNPLTHVSWHKIAPTLAQSFTVVAPDLRGYGDSSKPDGGPDHSAYSFRSMGQDNAELMSQLGFETFGVAGHDRGARVGFRMALDYPERVLRFAALDIVPTHHVLTNVTHGWELESDQW